MSDQNENAIALDDALLFEVSLVAAVDRATADFSRKSAGRRPFTDFVQIAPDEVRDACAAAVRQDGEAA